MTSENSQSIIETGSVYNKWLKVAPIIGSITAYAITYIYEVAYCNWFHIPTELITLNWTTIIFALAAGSIGILLVGWLYLSLLVFPKYSKKRMGPFERRFYFIFVIFIIVFAISRFLQINELINILVAFIFMGILLFVLPIFTKGIWTRKYTHEETRIGIRRFIRLIIKKYIRALKAYDTKQKSSASEFPNYFYNIMLGFVMISLLFGCVYLVGRYEAGTKKEFYIPSSNQTSLVLKIYEDNIICAPFTESEEGIVIARRYFVIKMSESPNVELINVKFEGEIGVLTEPYYYK